MTHRYAEALRWIADGKDVQIRWGLNSDWLEMAPRNEMVNDEVLRGRGQYEFRLKPRTVKIGSREVEAPVLEPVEGQTLWWYDSGTDKPIASEPSASEAAKGEWFASASAATAAYEAFLALLRGEA